MARVKSIAVIALLFVCARAGAELPPYVYLEMQEKAEEFLKIEVLTSKKEPGAVENFINPDRLKDGAEMFHIQLSAKVLSVYRTKSGLEVGDEIQIEYTHIERPEGTGWVGPAEIPVLKKGDLTQAYLNRKNAKAGGYSPAARGKSFQTMEE